MNIQLTRRDLISGASALGLAGVIGASQLSTESAQAAAYLQTPPKTLTVPHKPPVLHDAEFGIYGFAKYKNLHPTNLKIGRDLGVTRDPVGTRAVAWFDSAAGLTHGNSSPRSSIESPARAYSTAHGNKNAVYAHRIHFYLPSKYALRTTADWVAIGGVHGAPWYGPSRNGLMIVYNPATKRHYFRLGENKGFVREADTIIPLDRWVDVVVNFNYNYKSKGGWLRMFMNTTGTSIKGWKSIPVGGTRGFYRTDLISSQEGNGWYNNSKIPAATPRVGVYGNYPVKMYVKQHKFATTVKDSIGSGWDQRIDGKLFVG